MRILLLGFGTVGQALAALLDESRERLLARHGLILTIVGVVDSKTAVLASGGLDPNALLNAKQSPRGLAALAGAFAAPASLADLITSTDADCVVQAVPSDVASPAPAIEQLKAAFSSRRH